MNTSGFGGGFGEDAFNSTNQFGTPGGKPKQKRAQSVMIVTAKQINENTDETLIVHGNEVAMMTIVGIIQSVQITSTKITYSINDGTASIEATKWVEDGRGGDPSHQPLMENTYCKIVGSVKTSQGKNYVLVFAIHEIKDINMITKHMLENVFYKLNMETIGKMSNNDVNPAVEGGFSKGALPNTTTQMANSGIGGFTGPQNMVYSLIQLSIGDEGCNRETLYSGLKGKVQPRVIDETLDFLSGEGHTYTTVDDDHFKTTDI